MKKVIALKVLKPAEQQQQKSIENMFSKEQQNNDIKDELNEIKTIREKNDRNDLIYETNKYTFNFQQLETIRSFGNSVFSGTVTLDKAYKKQSNLSENILLFNNRARPRSKPNKMKKEILLNL